MFTERLNGLERITGEQFEDLRQKNVGMQPKTKDKTQATLEHAIYESEYMLRNRERELENALNELAELHSVIKTAREDQDNLIRNYRKNFKEVN